MLELQGWAPPSRLGATIRDSTPLGEWGIRLPPGSRIDDQPVYRSGLVEVQDEGSQLVAVACEPKDGERVLDLCAGAGGKALALAAAAPQALILATDTNRARLAKLRPRAERAEARSLAPRGGAQRLAGVDDAGKARRDMGS